MTKPYESVRDIWKFEAFLASDPKVWLSKANDLRQSAELLFQYDVEARERVFKQKTTTRLPAFWTAGPARMLIGFSLENMFKSLLLQDIEKIKQVFSREGNLSWGKDGHNLLALSQEAGFKCSDIQKRYCELWQLCALWAGRYPIPTNENYFPRQRKALPTREALLKRSKKRLQKALDENDPFLGSELWDMLHTGLSELEIHTFQEIYDNCYSLLEVAETK